MTKFTINPLFPALTQNPTPAPAATSPVTSPLPENSDVPPQQLNNVPGSGMANNLRNAFSKQIIDPDACKNVRNEICRMLTNGNFDLQTAKEKLSQLSLAEIDKPSFNGFTLASMATLHNENSLITLLASNGANFSAENEDGTSATMLKKVNLPPLFSEIFENLTQQQKEDELKSRIDILNNRQYLNNDPPFESMCHMHWHPRVKFKSFENDAYRERYFSQTAPERYASLVVEAKYLLDNYNAGKTDIKSGIGRSYLGYPEDLEKRSFNGTALHRLLSDQSPFSKIEHFSKLKLILALGIDVNSKDTIGSWTALQMLPFTRKPEEKIKLFLDAGADIHLTNDRGQQALHLAVWANQPGMTALLLEKGADPNLKDIDGNTSIHMGAQHSLGTSIFDAAGADFNVQNNRLETPLHLVAFRNGISTVKYLLDKGLDLNKTDFRGDTALHIAIQYRLEEMCYLLMNAGIDTTIVDRRGETAAVLAEAIHFWAGKSMLEDKVQYLANLEIEKAENAERSRIATAKANAALAANFHTRG